MEFTLEQKARRVKEILDDPVFNEAVRKVHESIDARWRMTQEEETQVRENLYFQKTALDEIERSLRSLGDSWTILNGRTMKKGKNK